jgi:allantoin racemase
LSRKRRDLPTILLIEPNKSAATTRMMVGLAEPLLPTGWTLRGCQAERGVAMITDEQGLAIAAEEVVRIGCALASDVDAILVAAFGDPGAEALRAQVSLPVVGGGEAALRQAGAGGRRFRVATTPPALVASIEARVRSLGLSPWFNGVRFRPGDPIALAASPAEQNAGSAEAVHACLHQDGAATDRDRRRPPQRECRTAGQAVRRHDRSAAAVGDSADLRGLGIDRLPKTGDLHRKQSDQGAGAVHGIDGAHLLERVVSMRGDAAKLASLIRRNRRLFSKDRWPVSHSTRCSGDQVRVPSCARRRFFIEEIENAQQGGFQRRVAGLHGVHEAHLETIPVDLVGGCRQACESRSTSLSYFMEPRAAEPYKRNRPPSARA